MRLLRKIRTGFHRWPLLAGAIVIGTGLATATPLLAAEKQPQSTSGAAAPCNFHPLDEENLATFFRGVKSVNLAILFEPDVRESLKCHGHEKECAEREAMEAGTAIPSGAKDKHIQFMTTLFKTLNDHYPQELYPEALTNLFRPMVKQLFAPVLPRDSSCEIPDPTMINPNSSKAAYASTSGSDVVNLMIQVTLVKKTTPHIVILTINTWRKGDAIYFHPLPLSTAFPLNQSEAEFKKQFADFVDGAKRSFTPTLMPEE